MMSLKPLLTETIRVRSAQIIGRDHALRQVNCQDSHAVYQSDDFIVGVVCDGCGEGQHSEVGATLAATFIVTQAIALLQEDYPIQAIPEMLYPRIIDYLDQLVSLSAPINRAAFIQHHLLFTIVGVLVAGERSVIFSAGDGMIILDDAVERIDQDNRPSYIAYHLLRDDLSETTLPEKFAVQYPSDWQTLAIATDGFDESLAGEIQGFMHPRGLQRQLNVWSNQGKYFRDDATLITLERLIPDPEADTTDPDA